jgi:hypothetical protein
VTKALQRPKYEKYPPGLVDQSRFETILRDLPRQPELPSAFDYATRAERYVCLAAEYVREFHTPKYRAGEVHKAMIALREKGQEYLKALKQSGKLIVDVYNDAANHHEWKVRRLGQDAPGRFGPDAIPTIGEAERITEAFLDELSRVHVADTGERGEKASESARAIVKQAAEDFERITGTKPSRATKRGRFIGFVEQIFEAAGVHGNPDYYVRHYLEK